MWFDKPGVFRRRKIKHGSAPFLKKEKMSAKLIRVGSLVGGDVRRAELWVRGEAREPLFLLIFALPLMSLDLTKTLPSSFFPHCALKKDAARHRSDSQRAGSEFWDVVKHHRPLVWFSLHLQNDPSRRYRAERRDRKWGSRLMKRKNDYKNHLPSPQMILFI